MNVCQTFFRFRKFRGKYATGYTREDKLPNIAGKINNIVYIVHINCILYWAEPQYEYVPQDTTVVWEERVEPQVSVTGTPQSKLARHHNKEEAAADHSIGLAEECTHTVPLAEARPQGVYKHVAKNTAEILQREAELHVIEREYENIPRPKTVSGVVPVAMFKEYMGNTTRERFREEHKVNCAVLITLLCNDCNPL